MRFSSLIWALLLLLIGPTIEISAQVYTVESIPDPKRGGSGYVSNPDNIISSSDVAILNRIIANMEDSTTAQVAVVVVQSIGDENPKDFAHRLFNTWGIGQAGADNGLLIFTVMDQRRTEFETGYGLEGVLPDVECYRIGMQELVPEFRAGRYGQGLINAVRRIQVTLEDPAAAEEIRAQRRSFGRGPSDDVLVVLFVYGFLAILLGSISISRIITVLRSQEDLYDKYLDLKKARWGFLMFLFPLPFIFVILYINRRLKRLRTEPRHHPVTGESMRLLSEQEEDPYLSEGQITEEEIGSVDYDVWATESGENIQILRYKKNFTRYKQCPSCDYVTYYQAHSRTIVPATYSSSGKREIVHKCKNCHHRGVKYQTIPRKTRSSSGGGSGGGFSGGGGSWGGGSSGGGGAGVSW